MIGHQQITRLVTRPRRKGHRRRRNQVRDDVRVDTVYTSPASFLRSTTAVGPNICYARQITSHQHRMISSRPASCSSLPLPFALRVMLTYSSSSAHLSHPNRKFIQSSLFSSFSPPIDHTTLTPHHCPIPSPHHRPPRIRSYTSHQAQSTHYIDLPSHQPQSHDCGASQDHAVERLCLLCWWRS